MQRSDAIVIPRRHDERRPGRRVEAAPAPAPSQANVAAKTTAAADPARATSNDAHTSIKNADTEQIATTATDGIGVGRSIGDMSQKQLRALLDDIDSMQAVPIIEPEPVSLKVDGTRSSSAPEGM